MRIFSIIDFLRTHSFTYCVGPQGSFLAPLLTYKSASFPISRKSKVIPAFLTAEEAKALMIALVSR